MTELEALRFVRDMAHAYHEEGNVLPELHDDQGVTDLAIDQQAEAISLVEDLLIRVTVAEGNPAKAADMAEQVMQDAGRVVVATIDHEEVREVLEECGLEDFAASLSNKVIGQQVRNLRSKFGFPANYEDWAWEIERRAAEMLAEANGLKLQEGA